MVWISVLIDIWRTCRCILLGLTVCLFAKCFGNPHSDESDISCIFKNKNSVQVWSQEIRMSCGSWTYMALCWAAPIADAWQLTSVRTRGNYLVCGWVATDKCATCGVTGPESKTEIMHIPQLDNGRASMEIRQVLFVKEGSSKSIIFWEFEVYYK